MVELSEELGNQLLMSKRQYEAFNQAIKVAKEQGVDPDKVESLITKKASIKKEYDSYSKKVLASIVDGTNLCKICEGWYGIRVAIGKTPTLRIYPLQSKHLQLLERNTPKEHDFTMTEIPVLIPAYIDEGISEVYNQNLTAEIEKVLLSYADLAIKRKSSKGKYKASYHACVRWVQRKVKIVNESQAEQYLRKNYEKVQHDVMEQFDKSITVWGADSDIEYRLYEPDNTIFIVGGDIIVTLYEEDFGFSKEINKSIVAQQLCIIHGCYDEILVAEQEHSKSLDVVASEIESVNADINLLQSQLELLEGRKSALLCARAEDEQKLKVAKAVFDMEFCKLFKRWRS